LAQVLTLRGKVISKTSKNMLSSLNTLIRRMMKLLT